MPHHKFRLSTASFKLILLVGTFATPVSAVCGTEKNEYLQSTHDITEQNLLNNWINNTQLIAGKRPNGGTSDRTEGPSSEPTSTSGSTRGSTSDPGVEMTNDANKLHHIFGQAKHKWSDTGLSQPDNIKLIERIANDPSNLVQTRENPHGNVHTYQGSYNGLTIEVVVFESHSKTQTINDAWVK